MRRFGVLVCGILLSVQGFASGGVTGKMGRSIKNLLGQGQVMTKLATVVGTTSVGVSSRNIGTVLAATAMSLGLVFGTLSVANANMDKRAQALDKKIGSAKVVDLGNGFQLDASGTVFGNWADHSDSTGKADTWSGGFGTTLGLSKALTAVTLEGKIMSNHAKQIGADEYSGGEDYTGRINVVQGIPIRGNQAIMPLLYAEGGGAQFYQNKRQTDATAGIGFQGSQVVFGKKMSLQVRVGFGGLWEGKHDGDEFANLEGDTVVSYGAVLNTGSVSLGRFLGAEEGTILDYIPLIPNATTSISRYHFTDDVDDKVTRINSTINVIEGLGISFEWNKRTGEEAHKSTALSFTKGIF